MRSGDTNKRDERDTSHAADEGLFESSSFVIKDLISSAGPIANFGRKAASPGQNTFGEHKGAPSPSFEWNGWSFESARRNGADDAVSMLEAAGDKELFDGRATSAQHVLSVRMGNVELGSNPRPRGAQ